MDKSFSVSFRLVEVSADLGILEDHLKLIEEQMDQGHQSAEEIRHAILEQLPALSGDDRRARSQFAYEVYDDYVEFQLPHILYNSFLVSLYAVYESSVTRIARLIQEKKEQKISLDDLKGDFLDRAQKYYQHVLTFELSKNNQSWERLKILAGLRHAIVHANGHLDMIKVSKRKKIQKWIEKDVGIEAYYEDIIVNQSFVRETFNAVKEDLKDLVRRYNELGRASEDLPQGDQF